MTYLADVNVWFALSYAAHVRIRGPQPGSKKLGADKAAMCRVRRVPFFDC